MRGSARNSIVLRALQPRNNQLGYGATIMVNWAEIHKYPDCYAIIVYDNYHAHDPDEAYAIAGIETAEEALEKCRSIVGWSLEEGAEPGRTAQDIIGYFKMFGDTPILRCPEGKPGVRFSALAYANEVAERFVQPLPPAEKQS